VFVEKSGRLEGGTVGSPQGPQARRMQSSVSKCGHRDEHSSPPRTGTLPQEVKALRQGVAEVPILGSK
jgi:hypothetical protein